MPIPISIPLDGMLQFATDYQGEFVTETKLVKGLNDGPEHAEIIANFLESTQT